MSLGFKEPKPSQITRDRNLERPGITLGQPKEFRNITGRRPDSI